MTTYQKLTDLGFTDICKIAIRLTVESMFQQLDTDTDLAERVLKQIPNENLHDWVHANAVALHAEHANAVLAPIIRIGKLFDS